MKAWISSNPRAALLVAVTVLLPLVLLLFLVVELWTTRQSYQDEIGRLEPRIARLKGLIDSQAQLDAALDRVNSRVQDLVYPASEDAASISAALQNRIREILADAGFAVENSQVLPAVREEGFERIAVKLTLSGDMAALDTALLDLATYSPLLLVESLEVWPEREGRGAEKSSAQRLGATLQLLSLRSVQ